MIDTRTYKNKIAEYVQRKNITIYKEGNTYLMSCLFHNDKNPSAVIYSENIFCPVCNKTFDIFNMAGKLIQSDNFVEQHADIEETLKLKATTEIINIKPSNKREGVKPKLVSIERARQLFSIKNLNEIAENKEWGVFKKAWVYTFQGKFLGVDVRFEGGKKKKAIVNFITDGSRIVHWSTPNMIYNYDEAIKTDKPLLFVEGCKCAEIAKKLKAFTPVTWNKGSSNAGNINWSLFKDKKCYMLPDDDDAGKQAAIDIKKKLPQLQIVPPVREARELKHEGADIEEVLKVMSIEDLENYIQNGGGKIEDVDAITDDDVYPFEILGVADDGQAYFLDSDSRLFSTALESLSINKMLRLCDMSFWKREYAVKGSIQWTQAINDLMRMTNNKDWNPDSIRGRGAWRRDDGEICYFDGKNITGKKDDSKLYVRRNPKPIGIDRDTIKTSDAIEIAKAVKKISFESDLDAMRMLAWSALSPFAGALTWRPSLLVTGESGSGKTSIVDYVIKRISDSLVVSGGETTSPGLRQYIGLDSLGIILEESECDTPKKAANRDDLFSLMRQSTSDLAPLVLKGSSEGKAVKFCMRSMFCFVAISPEINSIADQNRILKINLVRRKNNWKQIKSDLVRLLSPENCKGLRALTWKHLKTIMDNAEEIAETLQDETGLDNRTCHIESILLSAYIMLYCDKDNYLAETQKWIDMLKDNKAHENRDDEAEELVTRILDEQVFMSDLSKKKTVSETIEFLSDDRNADMLKGSYNDVLARHGLKLQDNNLYIAINHHEIMRIIDKQKGYHITLYRHKDAEKKSSPIHISGKTRRCVVIKNIFKGE